MNEMSANTRNTQDTGVGELNPASFLAETSQIPTATPISFADSDIPEYSGKFALVIDNVLTPEECIQLIAMAESSVPSDANSSPWAPALVQAPDGQDALKPGLRDCDRIIWFNQEVVDRIWARCIRVSGLKEQLAIVEQQYGKVRLGEWQFRRVNDRTSFLKYSAGQYFKPHSDGAFFYEANGTEFQTHYTLQLYLNDSTNDNPISNQVVGGATSFLSRDRKRRVDVNPKAGSVLLFQHDGLPHEGAVVKEGIKYTMRTDIVYEWVRDE